MKITQLLPTPTGVASGGGSVVAQLPIGLSYETLLIDYGGSLVPADMSNIRVVANGKPIQEYRSGTELNTYNVFNRRTTAATNTIIAIDFIRRLLPDRAMREATKLGTGKPVDLNRYSGQTASGANIPNPNYNPFPVQTLTLEMTLGTSVGSTGTIALYAIQSEAAPTGIIRKLRPFTYSPGATTYEIADLPKGDMINAVYFNYGVKITRIQLLRDNYTMFDRLLTLNNLIQTDDTYRTPQTGMFVHDTTESGFGDQVITTAGVNDFRYRLTFSTTPTTLTLSVDYIGQLDR